MWTQYDKHQLLELITELLELPSYPDHEEVEKVIKHVLDNREYGFYYTEVLNWYIYKNKNIFQDQEIVSQLSDLVDRIDILEHYPKQFGRMIINTCDDDLIKKYLNQIFHLFRTTPTPKFIEFLAKEYLLAHNFKHGDLKKYIKENSPGLSQYIEKYCENTCCIPELKEYKNQYLSKMKIDPILNYLWFMFICAKNESEILEEFAYYKNYFDRKLAYLFAAAEIDGAFKKGKVSFNFTYNIGNVKKAMDGLRNKGLRYSDEEISKLAKTYAIRNSNPVSHASSELLYENNQSFSELTGYIKFLNQTLKKVETFVTEKVENI